MELTDKNFGSIIAFWLPGFVLLWGLSFSNTEIAKWLFSTSTPSVGGFLYLTVASLALGLIISAIRYQTIDFVLSRFAHFPEIDFAKLKDKDIHAAFLAIVENHYRYYQYYSNTLVAAVIAVVSYVLGVKSPPCWAWLVLGILFVVLFFASWDCFKKYRERGSKVTS
jgi:hypothetical protein